jgi:hypothetical protein
MKLQIHRCEIGEASAPVYPTAGAPRHPMHLNPAMCAFAD